MARTFKLSGFKSTFDLDKPIIPNGSFTWAEALHAQSDDFPRLPKTKQEVENIIALAKRLQPIRDRLGKPIRITSWYRPEPFNSRAGGARYSQHLTGKAVDLAVEGYTGAQLRRLIAPHWRGGIGTYPNIPNIIHLDIGPERSW